MYKNLKLFFNHIGNMISEFPVFYRIKQYFEKHKKLKTILNYLYTFLIFFLICLPVIILNSSMNFPLLYDEVQFFVPTIYSNRFMSFSYNVGRDARFLPFQMLDYNLVLLFPDSFSKFHLVHQFLNLKFILFIFCLYYCSKYVCKLCKVKFSKSVFFCFTFPCIISSLYLFYEPVFAECTIAILFLIFMVTYLKAKIKQSKSLYIVSFFLVFYITYCKEIAFAIFFPLAFGNLIFNRKKITKLDKLFYYSIILNAVIFFVSYIFVLVYGDYSSVYYNVNKIKSIKEHIEYIEKVFVSNKFMYVCLMIYLYDIYKVLWKKDEYLDLHLLNLSGCVYMICFLLLTMNLVSYFYLCVFISIPTICLIAKKIKYKNIVYILLCLLIFQSIKLCNTAVRFFRGALVDEKEFYYDIIKLNKSKNLCCDINSRDVSYVLSYINNLWKDVTPKYGMISPLKIDKEKCEIYLKKEMNVPDYVSKFYIYLDGGILYFETAEQFKSYR